MAVGGIDVGGSVAVSMTGGADRVGAAVGKAGTVAVAVGSAVVVGSRWAAVSSDAVPWVRQATASDPNSSDQKTNAMILYLFIR